MSEKRVKVFYGGHNEGEAPAGRMSLVAVVTGSGAHVMEDAVLGGQSVTLCELRTRMAELVGAGDSEVVKLEKYILAMFMAYARAIGGLLHPEYRERTGDTRQFEERDMPTVASALPSALIFAAGVKDGDAVLEGELSAWLPHNRGVKPPATG